MHCLHFKQQIADSIESDKVRRTGRHVSNRMNMLNDWFSGRLEEEDVEEEQQPDKP